MPVEGLINNAINKLMIDANDIFNSESLPAREQVSEWVNVKEKIGDNVFGIFLGSWKSPSKIDASKMQISMAIKTNEGKVVGVSLNDSVYISSRLEASKVGDKFGVRYEGDKDTGKAQPAKIVKIYNPDLEDRVKKGEAVTTTVETVPHTPESAVEEAPF